MNTTKLLRLIFLCLCGTLFCLAACEDNALPANSNGTDGEAADLRFRVADRPDTRISYNGQSSTFNNDEAIGCIIATQSGGSYTYTANSKWHYTNGYLVLDEVFTWNYGWDASASTSHYMKNSVANLIERETENSEDGYLNLIGTGTYAFYFYYPYIDSDLLTEDYQQAFDKFSEDSSIPFYQLPEYPNRDNSQDLKHETSQWDQTLTEWDRIKTTDYGNRYMLMGAADNTVQSNGIYTYAWTAYPCFTNHTQRTQAQANNSDFLWVSVEGVSQAEHRTYNLWFNKKTATVAVDATEGIDNIYFTPQEENALVRGKQINLQDGLFTDYTPLASWETSPIQRAYMYFSPSETLTPYHNTGGDGYHRITFVPQSSFRCNLHFTLNGTAHTIDLSTEIPSLQEGYLYIIHINPAGQTTLEIVDWEQEHFEILNPTTE